LEAVRVVSRLERLDRRQVVEEAENWRVLHQERNQTLGYERALAEIAPTDKARNL